MLWISDVSDAAKERQLDVGHQLVDLMKMIHCIKYNVYKDRKRLNQVQIETWIFYTKPKPVHTSPVYLSSLSACTVLNITVIIPHHPFVQKWVTFSTWVMLVILWTQILSLHHPAAPRQSQPVFCLKWSSVVSMFLLSAANRRIHQTSRGSSNLNPHFPTVQQLLASFNI